MTPLISRPPLAERRRYVRRRAIEEHGIRAVRARPGHDVTLIDVSAAGAMVEGAVRMLPGAALDLQLITDTGRLFARGRVLRCAVVRLSPEIVWYRAGVAFERTLAGLTDDRGSEPDGVVRSDRPGWGVTTRVIR